MLHRTFSEEIPEPEFRMTVVTLLVFHLAGLLVLFTAGLSRAELWDETLAAAREEGKLVIVLGGGASRRYRPVFQYFEDKFNIQAVISTGSGRKQADRLLAERGARRYKVDIVMTGGTTGNTRFLPNRALDPITPELFHSEIVNKSLWYKGRHYYSDPEEKYIFAFSATADLTPIAMRFNTNSLPLGEAKKIDSVWTFLDKERFAGRIISLPPTLAGAGGTYFTAQIHPDLGEEYLRRLFDPELKVQFTQSYRQVADGIARGKYTIGIFIGSAGQDIDKLADLGLPVANFGEVIERPLKERPTLQGTSSSSNIMVVNRRPHPNAAKLFVNWFLSREGQTVVHTVSGSPPPPSFRVDVEEMGKVREADMRKPGVDYLPLAHVPEIQKKRLRLLKRSEKIYREIRGR